MKHTEDCGVNYDQFCNCIKAVSDEVFKDAPKHSMGPWKLHTGSDYICISDSKGEDVLSDILWAVYDEKEMANARLIAAAPDLLEACVHALRYAVPKGHASHEKLRAAIIKAKGE